MAGTDRGGYACNERISAGRVSRRRMMLGSLSALGGVGLAALTRLDPRPAYSAPLRPPAPSSINPAATEKLASAPAQTPRPVANLVGKLEGATVLLKESLAKLGSDATIEVIPGKDHGSVLDQAMRERIRKEMSAAYRKHHPE